MALNTQRLAYRFLTESDDWSAVIDKINYNFDQNKAFGGGDPGDRGFRGFRGLPGATGIGKKGEIGEKGATIKFLQVALTDGQQVTDTTLRDGDVVIDSNGIFFSVIKNNLGNLVYKFEYSLASAVAGSIVETQNQVVSQSTNPIVKWFLRDTGNPKDANALLVDRVVGTVTDEAQMYRMVIGDAGYPLLQNASFTLVNILPTKTALSAKENFFAQLAFKYRSAPGSNVSSNTGYIRYLELNKNEVAPAGPDDTYMLVDNISAGFGAVHDSITSDASYALIRGRNVRFMGKTPMSQLYDTGIINNTAQYMDVEIHPTETIIKSPGLFRIQAIAGEMALSATTLFSLASPKNFFQNALYVGAGNFNGGNSYAPAGGAVFEGAVGIGLTGAPSVLNNTKLHVNGGIILDPSSAIAWGGSPGNIEHVWVDDNTYQNVGGTFHFVADAGFKATGNAGIRAGGVFVERGEIYDRMIIGDAGWTGGFSKGLSVQGRSYFNDITEVGGKLWGYAGAEFNGVVGMETDNFYTRSASQVDIRGGLIAYIGTHGQSHSIWRYANSNTGGYDWLGWSNGANDWRLSYGGLERVLWHSGNDGAGSGLDADLLDGVDSFGFLRKNIADSGAYVQFYGTDAGGALYIHQQNGAAFQIQRWYFFNTLRAYCQVDGVQYATDFYILSDKKLKKDIKPIDSAIAYIKKLNPVSFKWKTGDGIEKTGFIAQEVEKILPNMVRLGEMGLSMSNSDLIPYLVKGLQEAFEEIEKLKKLIK